jgi:glc operon protein GlcG
MSSRHLILIALGAMLVAPSAGFSQSATPPATPAPAAAPAVPEVMPFDIPYGASISMDLAHKAIQAAAAEAQKHHWKMAISVVDPAGNLIAHATMDGTQYASIPIAQGKARTAALFRRPSKVFEDAMNSGGRPSVGTLLGMSGAVASEGGFPIVIDGKLIGAIGASGGISSQDAATAHAGLVAIGGK